MHGKEICCSGYKQHALLSILVLHFPFPCPSCVSVTIKEWLNGNITLFYSLYYHLFRLLQNKMCRLFFYVSLILKIKTLPPRPPFFFSVWECVKRFYCYACKERKKNGFGRTTTMETVKNFWGKVWLTGDFMNPHAISFTLLGFTEACGHVCIIFICGLPHIQNTCLHVHTHFYLKPSCKV